RIERLAVAETGLALTCANRPVKRRALAYASVSRVPLCHERSVGECVDQSSGYAQVREKKGGPVFTDPRLLIRKSLVRAQPGEPTTPVSSEAHRFRRSRTSATHGATRCCRSGSRERA